MRRARLFLQLHAALGERQRLLVAVLHQRDVRLVAAHRAEHVAASTIKAPGARPGGARHRLVEAPFLRERDPGERMHHREVATIAGRVQADAAAADVLADDRRVADLAIAETELVVGEPDGARVVRALRLLQRSRQERDAARRLAAGTARRPCIRQRSDSRAGLSRSRPRADAQGSAACRRSSWRSQASARAQRIWRSSSREVGRRLQRPGQQGGRVRPMPLLEGPNRRGVEVFRHGGGVYLVYSRWRDGVIQRGAAKALD